MAGAALATAVAAAAAGTALGAPTAVFRISTPAFQPGGPIPVRYTCDGANVSPRLVWTAPPKRAKSLALLMYDPDAPGGTFVHWTGWGIAPKAAGLAVGRALPREGLNSAGRSGYLGPCPPPGDGRHRYVFRLYALDVKLTLVPGATPQAFAAAIKGHVLRQTQVLGTYER